MALDRNILDEAAIWAVRTSEPGFEDWSRFTDWLEQSPEHAAAYDHVMLAAEDGAAMLDAHPANDIDDERPPPHRRWFGSALAACLVLVAALWVWPASDATSIYRTVPGETRQIALEDGSVIIMAGDSELLVDPDRDRYARLERGRALFEIRHDESNPFRVDVGSATLIDAGTVFDVSIRQSEVGVGVSEGAVIYNPARQNARIEPGHILTFDKASAAYDLASIPLDQVGEWREGRLTFLRAPLADVAADIARASGIDYRASETSGERPISGSIALEPLRADPAALGPLLGVSVERRGETWILASR